MRKLIIAVLAASGAAIVYAQAETSGDRERGGAFRAEMRALIAGDGMKVEDLAALMQERAATRFAALDADSDGVVTRDEYLAAASERTQGRFERMGPNEDGVVQRSGREGWGRHHRDGPRAERSGKRQQLSDEQRAERLGRRSAESFARLDSDGDGMISPQEFEEGMQARAERFAEHRQERGERAERRAQMRAEMPQEMREMHAQLRTLLRDGMTLDSFSALTQEHAAVRFDALDADGNGELSAEEFAANLAGHTERMFARMDRNQDGVVTSDDRARWGGGKDRGPRN